MKRTSNVLANLIVGTAKVVAVNVYKICFAWWLDKLLATRSEEHLRSRVRDELGFLFRDHGARFVPNDRIYRGGTMVTLELGNLLMRVGHSRGEDVVHIKPRHVSGEWEPISFALMATSAALPITKSDTLPPYLSFLSLSDLESIIRHRIEDLQISFAESQYPRTKEAIAAIRSFPRYAQAGILVRRQSEFRK